MLCKEVPTWGGRAMSECHAHMGTRCNIFTEMSVSSNVFLSFSLPRTGAPRFNLTITLITLHAIGFETTAVPQPLGSLINTQLTLLATSSAFLYLFLLRHAPHWHVIIYKMTLRSHYYH